MSGRLGHLAEHRRRWGRPSSPPTRGAWVAQLRRAGAYTIDWLIFFSDKGKVLTIGIVSCAGVVLGSALYALATRSFRWEGLPRCAEDTATPPDRRALMGVGGVTALGCTIGQGLSGLSTLSLTSFVAVAAIIAGAVAGLKYQFWLVRRSA